MGYYSTFTLETNPPMEPDTDLTKQLAEAFRNTQPDYFRNWGEGEDDGLDFVTGESALCNVKWYDCAEDITKISMQFPDIAFAITRLGEDSDVEAFYAKDGTIEIGYRDVDLSRPSPTSDKFKELFN